MSPPRRTALHQRSDSDANVPIAFPNPASTLKIVPRSSTSSEATRAAKHRKSNSNSTTTTSRSAGTVRSQVSFENLPPVPPLRIQKSRGSRASFGIFQDPEPATATAAAGPTRALLQGSPCSSAASVSNSEEPHQNLPCTPPRMPARPPRSILKKPSRPTFTPYTEEEYLNKSSEWVANYAVESPQSRARMMNAHTLRLVNDDEGAAHMPGGASPGGVSTLSRSPSDAMSTRSVRLPDWAKYVGPDRSVESRSNCWQVLLRPQRRTHQRNRRSRGGTRAGHGPAQLHDPQRHGGARTAAAHRRLHDVDCGDPAHNF